jgi:predicted transcriptional regulator
MTADIPLTQLEKRILLILLDNNRIDLDRLCFILNESKTKILLAIEKLKREGYIHEEVIGVGRCDGRD